MIDRILIIGSLMLLVGCGQKIMEPLLHDISKVENITFSGDGQIFLEMANTRIVKLIGIKVSEYRGDISAVYRSMSMTELRRLLGGLDLTIDYDVVKSEESVLLGYNEDS